MRVIAGMYRSRVLAAPKGLATRPTSDRLRETLFNVLAPRMEGAAFLDLFAGSGAVGIEALSRGAARVTFVERAPAAAGVLRQNLERLGIKDRVCVQAGSVGPFLRRAGESGRYNVVFLDPPYEAAEEYDAVLGMLGGVSAPRSVKSGDLERPAGSDRRPALVHPLLAAGAVVVAEHRRKDRLEERYGALKRTRLLEQGDAGLSFYEADGER